MSDSPPPRPPAPPVPPAPRGGGSGATARGLVLIVAAVLVGIVILRSTDPSPTFASESRGPIVTPSTDGQPEETAPEDTTSSTDGGEEETTTTAGEGGDRSEVSVVVANAGGGVPGLAGRVAARVEGAGFTDVAAADADAPAEASVVYFAPGAEDAAAAVAELFDAAPRVSALPDPPPGTSADVSGADVVVLATADLDE